VAFSSQEWIGDHEQRTCAPLAERWARQVENDEKGVAAADTPGGPPGSDVG